MSQSSLQELEKITLSALNAFRETAAVTNESALYYVIALFTLKFISGLRDECTNPANTERLRPAWSNLAVPPECDWESIRLYLGKPEFNFLLDSALNAAEESNPEILGGTFSELRFEPFARRGTSDTKALSMAFERISDADLRPSKLEDPEQLGDFFENLLHLIAESPYAGEFHVPSTLASLLARLLAPRPGEVILDPLCGSGALLSSLVRHAGSQHGPILGQDYRLRNLSLCKINLLFRGARHPKIELANALTEPLLDSSGRTLKADIVLTNPPFGWRDWGGEQLQHTRPELFRWNLTPRSPSEAAFLSHMLEVARDKVGRIGIIVSHGTLFRQEERGIRRRLVEENLLAGVVALPPKMFHGTKIPVAILILDKGRTTEDVIFVDASKSAKTVGRLSQLPESEISRIVGIFRSPEIQPRFSCCASPTRIREVDYQLTAQLYVDYSGKNERTTNFAELSHEIIKIERELEEVRSEIDDSLRAMGMDVD